MNWLFRGNIFRSLGFVRDQKGIMRRYKRERKLWDTHLNKSKQYILKAMGASVFKSVAVLGSGYLLDLPIDEILVKTDCLYLYDVNHPKEIISKYQNHPKVRFVTKDITGLAEEIYITKNQQQLERLMQKEPQSWAIDGHDFIISLNILNQLDILLVDFLKERFNMPEETEKTLRRKIQNEHVISLQKTFSVLIADVYEYHTQADGTETDIKKNVYIDINSGEAVSGYEEWDWQFDSSGRYILDSSVLFKVNAVTYNKSKQICAE